jgi:hypothetical protein
MNEHWKLQIHSFDATLIDLMSFQPIFLKSGYKLVAQPIYMSSYLHFYYANNTRGFPII